LTAARVWLERRGNRLELPPDTALTQESAAWQWFAVPEGWPVGATTLALHGNTTFPGRLPIAWDDSGLRLRREDRGVRLWEWEAAPTLAFLASDVRADGGATKDDPHACTVPPDRVPALRGATVEPAAGTLTLDHLTPTVVQVQVTVAGPALLVIQVKYRPGLWCAEVNHKPVTSERVNGVWTGVVVPAGRSQVTLKARVPLPIWLLSGAATIAVAALAAVRRA